MFAVVLVGGFGTRLRPLTDDVPKPMLPIVHRPMIVRLAERLAEGGVTDVVLALGFRPEPFRDAFPDGRVGTSGVRVHYAVEPEPLDTAGAVAFAARSVGVDDTFVVANGDVLTDVSIGWLVTEHRRIGVDATIHLIPVDDPSAFGVVELDGPIVRRFVEKPAAGESDSFLVNAGTYVFEPAVLDLVEPGRRVSIERSTFPALVSQRRLAAVASDDYWIDAGRPETYRRANIDLVTGRRGAALDGVAPGAAIDASASVDARVVAEHAVVGAGAEVVRSVVLDGAVVGAGASVVDSIVVGSVGASARLIDCVVGAGHSVDAGAELVGVRVPEPS
ncbi:MAG: sugar phosphate nucleotidyltransferase [Ilumatobacteraceae bacterium]